MRQVLLEIPSHFYDSSLWRYIYIAWTSILECMTYICLDVQPIHLAGSLRTLLHLGVDIDV
jgi:hypothetical protein